MLASSVAAETANGSNTAELWTVDPWNPCVMYGAPDRQTIERTTDGKRWSRVFANTQPALLPYGNGPASTAFTLSSMYTPAPGEVLLGEYGNGDGVVTSVDQGRTWTLRDDGLAGLGVLRMFPAPSNRNVTYAVVTERGGSEISAEPWSRAVALYVTTDGGDHWSPLLPPPGTVPLSAELATHQPALTAVAVDRTDAMHLWSVWATSLDTTCSGLPALSATCSELVPLRWSLFESRDGGQSWSDRGELPRGDPHQLAVIQSGRHAQRLAVIGTFRSFPSSLAISDDDGGSWRAPAWATTVNANGELAVSPADEDVDVLVVGACRACGAWADDGYTQEEIPHILVSDDGLDSGAPATPPQWPGAILPGGDSVNDIDALAGWTAQDWIQADRYGDFYVNLSTYCNAPGRYCPATKSGSWTVHTFWRFTPPVAPAGGGGSFAGTSPAIAVGAPLVELPTCPIPPPPVTAAQAAPVHASGGASTVAYDGYDLLYTYASDTETPGSNRGVIHALDPTTCLPHSDIVVQFSQSDLDAWARTNHYSKVAPVIDEMAYDQRRNVIWAAIQNLYYDGIGYDFPPGLFAISVESASSGASRLGSAHLVTTDGCGPLLAFDLTRDSLWTCHGYVPATLRASDGSLVPSCAQNVGGFWGDNDSIGTWTFGAPNDLYVYREDDVNVQDYDPTTCTWKATYTHRAVSEPANEDEEMACDPLTYGPDSALGATGQWTAALWMRDADISSMTPYAIPNGFCPLPTTTTYTGATRALPGAVVDLCATITHIYPGGGIPLAQMPAHFALSGPQSIAVPGVAVTGGAGGGCVAWRADVPAGRYTISAAFDPAAAHRAPQYLPSRGEGTLVVLPVVGPAVSGNAVDTGAAAVAVPPPAEPPPAPQPGPGPQAQGAPGFQAQAEAQAQSQAQGQAQSVAQTQPGMMVQQRTREQVAAQTARRSSAQAEPLLATRRQHAPLAPAVELIAGALMLCLGVIARRPALARARRRRPRR